MTIIKLEHITKVEGHADLTIKIEGNKIKDVRLEVFEGARLFEALIKGRHFEDVPHITARICGICSASHFTAAVKAVEDAMKVNVNEKVYMLRELLNVGEIIQSHALHLFLLALPDYLGYSDALSMVDKYKKEVLMGLELKALGNKIMKIVGGRELHPLSLAIGGFKKFPEDETLIQLKDEMKAHLKYAQKAAKLFSGLKTPVFKRYAEYICLNQDRGYPLISGGLTSTDHLDIPVQDYDKHLNERIIEYSTAKQSTSKNKSFFVGALGRINNWQVLLSKKAKKAIKKSGITFPNYNSFLNNFAQAVEIIHYLEFGIELIDKILDSNESVAYEPVKPKQGRGVGIIEAPRGILIHDYTIDKNGIVKKANVITPTSMNLKNIEEDIKAFLPKLLGKDKHTIIMETEKLIRAYDPCISCSTHFLNVKWE